MEKEKEAKRWAMCVSVASGINIRLVDVVQPIKGGHFKSKQINSMSKSTQLVSPENTTTSVREKLLLLPAYNINNIQPEPREMKLLPPSWATIKLREDHPEP